MKPCADDLDDLVGKWFAIRCFVTDFVDPINYAVRLARVNWLRTRIVLEFDGGDGTLPMPVDWRNVVDMRQAELIPERTRIAE